MYEDWPANVSIPFQCDRTYDGMKELWAYIWQSSILLVGALMHIWVLWTMNFTYKKIFRQNSFYKIFSMDCVASLYIIVIEVSWYRLMRYIPRFCDWFGDSLKDISEAQRLSHVVYQYAKVAKYIIQVFLTLNRLTSVVYYMKNEEIWKKITRFAIVASLLIPIPALYNSVFGRYYPESFHGGVVTKYSYPFLWLSIVSIHRVLMIIAGIVSMILSISTFYKIQTASYRMKKAEMELCYGSLGVSTGYFVVGMIQLSTFFLNPDADFQNFLSNVINFGFDYLNVSTPLILIIACPQLRKRLCPGCTATTRVGRFTRPPTTHAQNTQTLSTRTLNTQPPSTPSIFITVSNR